MALLLFFLLPGIAVASLVVESDSLGSFERLPPNEAAHISAEIWHLLDLGAELPPAKPRRSAAGGRSLLSHQDEPAVTTFMQDVYKELGGDEQEEADIGGGGGGLGGDPASLRFAKRTGQLQERYNVSLWLQDSLHEADLIVSVPPDDSIHLSPTMRSQQLVFRFDHLRGDISVMSAELRLFRSHEAFAGESMTLILHRLTERGGTLETAEHLVSRLAPGQTGWLELNVTSFVRSWMSRPEENAGLRLQLLSAKDFPLPPDLLGFETAPHRRFSPFIVASFRETARKLRRVRRSALPSYSEKPRKRRAWTYKAFPKRHCTRRELRVDFKELNWDQWVIAPRMYSAYYCGGDCPIPLHPSWNSTNHSIVQTLLSLHTPSKKGPVVPPPCCVPIALQSMKMLYYDHKLRVMLRTYHDMKVKTCGCH